MLVVVRGMFSLQHTMRVIHTVSQNYLGFDQIQTSCCLDKTLLTIDVIRGIFDHSAACEDVVDMQ